MFYTISFISCYFYLMKGFIAVQEISINVVIQSIWIIKSRDAVNIYYQMTKSNSEKLIFIISANYLMHYQKINKNNFQFGIFIMKW